MCAFGAGDRNTGRVSSAASYSSCKEIAFPYHNHMHVHLWWHAKEHQSFIYMETRDLHKYGQLNFETGRVCIYILWNNKLSAEVARIIELLRLEKTSKIIKSNCQCNTTMPAKPCPEVPYPQVFLTPPQIVTPLLSWAALLLQIKSGHKKSVYCWK